MSSADRILMILHLAFAIFAIGPLTAATMSTPRHIRRRDTEVLRHLNRNTRIYGLLTLGIFLFGALLAHGKFSQMWLSASMTLFIVALVLLLLVERDQRKALHTLELAAAEEHSRTPAAEAETEADETAGPAAAGPRDTELAKVESGRIAAISGVVALIWIVILILMVWH